MAGPAEISLEPPRLAGPVEQIQFILTAAQEVQLRLQHLTAALAAAVRRDSLALVKLVAITQVTTALAAAVAVPMPEALRLVLILLDHNQRTAALAGRDQAALLAALVVDLAGLRRHPLAPMVLAVVVAQ